MRVLILIPLALACSNKKTGSPPVDSGDTSTTEQRAPIRIASYNAGLAPGYVPSSEERREHTIEAIASLEAELICLQEVWLQEDIDAVLAATAATHPHQFVEITTEKVTDTPACTKKEIQPVVDCANKRCADSKDLVSCVLAECGEELGELSDACFDCAAANIGLNDIDLIAEACTTGSAQFTWDGHNGLMLLSSLPLVEVGLTTADSWLVQRAWIGAELQEGVAVACTHLAADLSETTAYDGEQFSSYEEEQAAQLSDVLAWLDATELPAVLAGDLNTGPELVGQVAELPDNWQQVEDAGYIDANIAEDAAFCTWCPEENSLLDKGGSKVIDHVAARDATAIDPLRLLDSPVEIDGLGPTSLSDHFGVQVTVVVEAESGEAP